MKIGKAEKPELLNLIHNVLIDAIEFNGPSELFCKQRLYITLAHA